MVLSTDTEHKTENDLSLRAPIVIYPSHLPFWQISQHRLLKQHRRHISRITFFLHNLQYLRKKMVKFSADFILHNFFAISLSICLYRSVILRLVWDNIFDLQVIESKNFHLDRFLTKIYECKKLICHFKWKWMKLSKKKNQTTPYCLLLHTRKDNNKKNWNRFNSLPWMWFIISFFSF